MFASLATLARSQLEKGSITRRASSFNKKMWSFLINNKPISFHAWCHSPRLLEKLEKAKEAKRRRLEATCTATSTDTIPLRLESLPFLSS